ncbi:NnrU family protein [Gellertiella hungarica]|uniref:Putative membrane protein n=1 Tax=Gellertiella hungarica TaxID=1572859 RepID=A0A7W6NJF0_9HYPH|nr:NnrU family protein [Gellertiella hungarica]MBB4063325.1 putative membrane protein [Gellertiella hungarica]
MALLIIGLIAFLGFHMLRVVAPGLRQSLIASMGRPAYMGLYSVLSIATLALLVYGFGQARLESGEPLYVAPAWMVHLTVTLMLIALILAVSSVLPAGYIATKTRHPLITSVKVWALAHLLVNGEAYSVVTFAAFLAWAVVLRIAVKRRARAGEVTERAYVGWIWDLVAVVIGLGLAIALIKGLHLWLIGVPIPMAG